MVGVAFVFAVAVVLLLLLPLLLSLYCFVVTLSLLLSYLLLMFFLLSSLRVVAVEGSKLSLLLMGSCCSGRLCNSPRPAMNKKRCRALAMATGDSKNNSNYSFCLMAGGG